ncbi:hypothetical protein ACQP0C_41730 (plasmid) [Nocardia sp. CA-129566]|uniref:hypothetical protein n=1 Tax=Nocardia sp. CA-129566 TaxID=3239976 RepID=UPI003D98571D
MTLIPVTIPLRDHNQVTLTGEQVSTHFALVPATTLREDGTLGFASHGYGLTHIPTGRAVTFDTFVDPRRLALALEELPIDWANLTEPTRGQTALVHETYLQVWNDPEKRLPWPAWAGDESTPALSLIVHQLDDQLDNTEHRRELRRALEQQIAAYDPELGHTVTGHLLASSSIETVSAYALVYLLAAFMRTDPAAADRAARHVTEAWEHGDDASECIYQWRQQIADQVPMQLPGFPDLPTAATVTV